MSLDFDQAGDSVTLASQTMGDNVTASAWFYADDQGDGDAARLIEQNNDANDDGRWSIAWNGTGSSKKLRFQIDRTTTSTVWDMTTGFANITGWKWVMASFDLAGFAAFVWVWEPDAGTGITLITPGAGLTEVAAGSGTIEADNTTVRVGLGRAGAFDWDGRIGEVGLWTAFMQDRHAYAAAILGVPSVLTLSPATPLHLYWPLGHAGTAAALDFSGNARNGTISGATHSAENPPIRPGGRRG